jgi:hypothetical protein
MLEFADRVNSGRDIAVLSSAIQSLRAIQQVDRNTFERIMKNAAALQMMSVRKGPYKAMR